MALRHRLRQGALLIAGLTALYMGGCRKSNGIDNNQVIQTPYGLYFTDAEGVLYNTNGGPIIKAPFPEDGISMRSLTVAGLNVLFVKKNVHLSQNNSRQFNVTDTVVLKNAFFESLMLNVSSHGRVYLCIDSMPTKGIKYSEDFGVTWKVEVDSMFDTSVHAPYGPSSFAQTRNNDLFAYNNRSGELIKRTSKTDKWFLVRNPNGLDTTKHYFLSHFNNALIAADTAGRVLYSNDAGLNFNTYPGLPGNKIYSVASPLDQVLLVGTDSAGLYRLVSGQFIASNNGLSPHTIVYSITGKEDTYKNGVIRQYMYIATNTGLYRSEDGGQNWTLEYPGDIRRVY